MGFTTCFLEEDETGAQLHLPCLAGWGLAGGAPAPALAPAPAPAPTGGGWAPLLLPLLHVLPLLLHLPPLHRLLLQTLQLLQATQVSPQS